MSSNSCAFFGTFAIVQFFTPVSDFFAAFWFTDLEIGTHNFTDILIQNVTLQFEAFMVTFTGLLAKLIQITKLIRR